MAAKRGGGGEKGKGSNESDDLPMTRPLLWHPHIGCDNLRFRAFRWRLPVPRYVITFFPLSLSLSLFLFRRERQVSGRKG